MTRTFFTPMFFYGVQRAALGLASGIATFFVLGTVAAIWKNPLFMRMVPVSGFELSLLAAQSLMIGVYFAIPVKACATRSASVGGVIGFLGIACPVCNKLLVLTVGPALLMQYFEPVRIYVGLAGLGLVAYAVVRKAAAMQGRSISFG